MDIQLAQRNQSKSFLFVLPSCVTFGYISGDCVRVGLESRLSILTHGSIHLTMHSITVVVL